MEAWGEALGGLELEPRASASSSAVRVTTSTKSGDVFDLCIGQQKELLSLIIE